MILLSVRKSYTGKRNVSYINGCQFHPQLHGPVVCLSEAAASSMIGCLIHHCSANSHKLRCTRVGGRCLRSCSEVPDRRTTSAQTAEVHRATSITGSAPISQICNPLSLTQLQTIQPPKESIVSLAPGALFHCSPVELMKKPSPSPRDEVPPAPASIRTGCHPLYST